MFLRLLFLLVRMFPRATSSLLVWAKAKIDKLLNGENPGNVVDGKLTTDGAQNILLKIRIM